MSIEFTSRLTQKEYIKYLLINYYTRPLVVYLHACFLLPGLYLLFTKGDQAFEGHNLIYLGLLVYAIISPLLIYYNGRKNFTSNTYLKDPVIYTIDEAEITVKGKNHGSVLKWQDVYKCKESSDFFLVFTSNVTAYFLPKHSFSKEELTQFKSWMQRYKKAEIGLKPLLTSKLAFIAYLMILTGLGLFSYEKHVGLDQTGALSLTDALFNAFFVILSACMISGVISAVFALIPFKRKPYKIKILTLFFIIISIVMFVYDFFLMLPFLMQ